MDNKNLVYIFLAVFILLSVSFASGTLRILQPTPNTILWGNISLNASWDTADIIANVTFWNNIGGTWTMFASCLNATGSTSCNMTYNSTKMTDAQGIKINATGYDRIVAASQVYNGTNVSSNINIDNTAPVITLEVPGNNTWNTSTVYFAFSVVENNPTWCNLTINGANNKTNGSAISSSTRFTYASTVIADSTTAYLWNVYCLDYPGNKNAASANFSLKIDGTSPSGGEITMPKTTNIYAQNLIKISCAGSDATSGLNKVNIKITKPSGKIVEYDLGSGEEQIIQGITTGEAGKNLVDCTVYDVAGNTLAVEQKFFNVYNRIVKSAEAKEEPKEEVTPTPEEKAPTEGEEVPTEKAPSKAWIWILVIVVVVLVLYFVLKKKK